MSLTKAKDPQFSHFGDAKKFRAYMRKEAYWAHMYTEAAFIIQKLEVEGPKLPDGFDGFYKLNMKNHVPHAYASLLEKVRNSNDQDKMPELAFSTKRLVYRYISCVKDSDVLCLISY